MTDTTTPTPRPADWPAFTPSWAERMTVEPDAYTFERTWTLPSPFRDAEPLPVFGIEQTFTRDANTGEFEAEPARVMGGPMGLWADFRTKQIATTLREFADALDPQDDASAGGA